MKKNIITAMILVGAPFISFAQNTPPAGLIAQTLPDAGLVPGNFWYFLDRFGETLNTFYTFKAESKARLALEHAQERAAEINILLAEKTADAPEVKAIREDFNQELVRAGAAIAGVKNDDAETASRIQEIRKTFENSKEALVDVYNKHENVRESKKNDILKDLAKEKTGTPRDSSLKEDLMKVEDEVRVLRDQRDSIEHGFSQEGERFDGVLGAQVSAQNALDHAPRARAQFVSEMTRRGFNSDPAVTSALADFDALVVKAKQAFADKDFENSKEYAHDAESMLADARSEVSFQKDEEDFWGDDMKQEDDERGEKGDAVLKTSTTTKTQAR